MQTLKRKAERFQQWTKQFMMSPEATKCKLTKNTILRNPISGKSIHCGSLTDFLASMVEEVSSVVYPEECPGAFHPTLPTTPEVSSGLVWPHLLEECLAPYPWFRSGLLLECVLVTLPTGLDTHRTTILTFGKQVCSSPIVHVVICSAQWHHRTRKGSLSGWVRPVWSKQTWVPMRIYGEETLSCNAHVSQQCTIAKCRSMNISQWSCQNLEIRKILRAKMMTARTKHLQNF